MITYQNQKELLTLSESVRKSVYDSMVQHIESAVNAGICTGENKSKYIWIKDGNEFTFFFICEAIKNARAETFINCNCGIEYTLHLIQRYKRRCPRDICIDIPYGLDLRWHNIIYGLVSFYLNEQILGVLAYTPHRGEVLRTTHGLILCSEKELHKGVQLANTFISDNELAATQRKAVELWNNKQYESARSKYLEYFNK